jgi:uncharacterized protein YndB with AHSA1/START domain
MHIDIGQHIGATTRQVSSRTHNGKEARVVVVSRTYSTTPDDLWNAVTSAERLPRWFAPVSGDLRLGGRYQVQGNAGGQILVCEPPRQLKLTWEFGGNTSWVDVGIATHADGAILTLEHTMILDDHWKQFGAGATGVGWDLALVGLAEHIDTGSAKTVEEGMAWMTSDNGKAFVRESSEAWGAAAVAGGEDAAAAKAGVAATTAAYTGS